MAFDPNSLNPIAGVTSSIAKGLDELFTSDEERMRAELLLQQQLQQPHILQAMTNLEEAKNPNWFVSGWRPALGWLCVVLLAYSWIGRDLIVISFDLLPNTYTEIVTDIRVKNEMESASQLSDVISDELATICNRAPETTCDTQALLDLTEKAEGQLQQVHSTFVKAKQDISEQQRDLPITESLPELDTGSILSLVLALLGLGATRTYEKVKGVARTQWKDSPTSVSNTVIVEDSKPDIVNDFTDKELNEAFSARGRS